MQLAQHYYGSGEYDKAVVYYERLFKGDPSKFNFNRLLTCKVQLNELKEAEKLIKKQVSSNPRDIDYKIVLGNFYEDQGEKEKADKVYHELINELTPSASQIISVYTAFKAKGKNDLAFQTLQQGRKILKDSYPLNFQFAEYYGSIGQNDKMIQEYLDLLDYHSGYSSSVQNILARQIDFSATESAEYTQIQEALMQRVQKKPNDTYYSELLIWFYVQSKNFNGALLQVQALDKRLEQSGRQVYDLGKICVENQDYKTARKAFKYVTNLGNQLPYYYVAENALLNTYFLEVTNQRDFTETELNEIIQHYENALDRSGRRSATLPLLLELCYIQAYYADRVESSKANLSSALEIKGLTDMQRAEVKMLLADIHVLHGDIWEASLLYMQVEKDFHLEPIGHEAKFKNARIFYYDGEFNYAQSQLDVLKQSTSKLIANDALKLSLLITDNFGLDSNYTAMFWFASADLLIEQHKFDMAFQLLDSVMLKFPYHSLGDEIHLRKGQAYEYQGKWMEAVKQYEELLDYYSTDILADDALYRLAMIYLNHLNDKEKSKEYLKRILFDYKGSLYSDEVRRLYRELRGEVEIN